ncbi:MAG: histidinol-phosphate transaminase [Candidatus Kapabacteria bacterium]|nr:histidinol-phosphate transaminase [Candidatus Kapabacteria bacterium]
MIEVPRHIIDLQPYKPGRLIEDIQKEYGFERVIKLASNENPLGVSPLAIQAMINSIHQLNRYPDIASMTLRTKLSEFFHIETSCIITGHGSEAIIQTLMRTFLNDDDEAITVTGTFVGFYVITKAIGIKLHLLPLDENYGFDLGAILDAITPKTKVIYLVNPNSPTGTIFTKKQFEEFINLVPENIIIIVDEAYFEFVTDNPDFPNSMDYRRDNIVTLRTFSKAYGLAGIRIGYGFANPELVGYMLKVRLPFEPGIPSQAAGIAALTDKQFLDYYLKVNKTGKEFLYNLYDELGIRYIKSEANFVMTVHDSEEEVNRINEQLLRRGVIIRPLRPFGLPHCLRVTIGLPDENEIYAFALKQIL